MPGFGAVVGLAAKIAAFAVSEESPACRPTPLRSAMLNLQPSQNRTRRVIARKVQRRCSWFSCGGGWRWIRDKACSIWSRAPKNGVSRIEIWRREHWMVCFNSCALVIHQHCASCSFFHNIGRWESSTVPLVAKTLGMSGTRFCDVSATYLVCCSAQQCWCQRSCIELTLHTIAGLSSNVCAELCLMDASCYGFAYYQDQGHCQLLAPAAVRFQATPGIPGFDLFVRLQLPNTPWCVTEHDPTQATGSNDAPLAQGQNLSKLLTRVSSPTSILEGAGRSMSFSLQYELGSLYPPSVEVEGYLVGLSIKLDNNFLTSSMEELPGQAGVVMFRQPLNSTYHLTAGQVLSTIAYVVPSTNRTWKGRVQDFALSLPDTIVIGTTSAMRTTGAASTTVSSLPLSLTIAETPSTNTLTSRTTPTTSETATSATTSTLTRCNGEEDPGFCSLNDHCHQADFSLACPIRCDACVQTTITSNTRTTSTSTSTTYVSHCNGRPDPPFCRFYNCSVDDIPDFCLGKCGTCTTSSTTTTITTQSTTATNGHVYCNGVPDLSFCRLNDCAIPGVAEYCPGE